MKRFFRVTALVLALILACTSFAGCFGAKKKGPEKQIVDKVYKYNTVELVSIEEPNYENPEDFAGTSYIGHTSFDSSGYVYTLQEVDKDYRSVALTAYIGDANSEETVTIPLEVYDDDNGYRYIQNVNRIPGGVLVCAFENKTVDAENGVYSSSYLAEIYGEDGAKRSSIDFKKALSLGDDQNQYFSINQLAYVGGDVFVTAYCEDDRYQNKILRFALDGTLKETISILPDGTEGYINSLQALGDNKLCIPYETYGQEFKQAMLILDLLTGERKEIDTGNNHEVAYRSFVGEDGNLYYSNEEGIYLFDTATGEGNKVVDFINSDYIYKYGRFYAVDSEHFLTLGENYEDGTSTLLLTTFEKVPEEELVPKYLIKVASAGGAYNFREQIIEFNLASEEYRIQYVDYSQYNTEDDWEAGKTKLNNDIIAGNIPDVLITDQEFSAAKYANKGLFADLYTFMDKDATLSRDKFLGNILSACETNGKLYEIPTSIYLMGLMGIKDTISEFKGLTMRQFADKVKALPEGVSFFREGDSSRNSLLELFFFVNYVNYVNPTTGLCSLNNDDFKAMLEWLSTQPEKSRWEMDDFDYDTFDYEAYENMFKEGKAIAEQCSIDNFDSFANYAYSFGDSPVDFVGIPSPDGDGIVFTATNLKFLVSAKGNFPEQAWEFVKVFFTDDNQRELGWGFPVTKSALDLEKQEALDRIAEREKREEEDSGVAILPEYGVGGGMIGMPNPMGRRYTTREEVETIYGYVTNVKKQLRYDDSILDIIKEEASEYFGGKKSLDDVAVQAESRVNIKLGEQY
ncbi:MAG: extracellular solute-binding protein [Clostridia bacterium]|nr:extracellular solute-binding protein [Clostridia bacterium]